MRDSVARGHQSINPSKEIKGPDVSQVLIDINI